MSEQSDASSIGGEEAVSTAKGVTGEGRAVTMKPAAAVALERTARRGVLRMRGRGRVPFATALGGLSGGLAVRGAESGGWPEEAGRESLRRSSLGGRDVGGRRDTGLTAQGAHRAAAAVAEESCRPPGRASAVAREANDEAPLRAAPSAAPTRLAAPVFIDCAAAAVAIATSLEGAAPCCIGVALAASAPAYKLAPLLISWTNCS